MPGSLGQAGFFISLHCTTSVVSEKRVSPRRRGLKSPEKRVSPRRRGLKSPEKRVSPQTQHPPVISGISLVQFDEVVILGTAQSIHSVQRPSGKS